MINGTATNDAPATDPSLDNETPSTETVENRARKKRKSQQQNAGEGVFPTAVIVNGEQGQSSKRRKKNNTTSAEEGNPEPPPLRYKAPTNASPGFNLDPALDVGGALGIQAPEDSDVNHAEESGQMIPTIGLQPASLHLQIPTLPILDNLVCDRTLDQEKNLLTRSGYPNPCPHFQIILCRHAGNGKSANDRVRPRVLCPSGTFQPNQSSLLYVKTFLVSAGAWLRK